MGCSRLVACRVPYAPGADTIRLSQFNWFGPRADELGEFITIVIPRMCALEDVLGPGSTWISP